MQVRGNPFRNVGGMLGERRWMALGGLVAVLALWGLAVRVQGATEQKAPAAQTSSAVAVKTAAVTQGPVVASLSYTGDVKALSQVNVLPKGTGRIEKLLVDVGSRVKKGDVLAELDSASLQAQVSQARANLAAATARLAGLEAGPRSEQVAQAKASLDSAREKLAAMEQGGRDEQVAQAQAALDAALAKQATLKKGATAADLQAAQSAVDSARANVQIAEARLETLKQGPTQTEWGSALAAVDSARANMKAAEARLAEVQAGPKPADLQAAQAAVDQAKAALDGAQDRWDYAQDNNDTSRLGAVGVTSAGQAWELWQAAQTSYNAAVEKQNLLKSSPLPADLQAAQTAYDGAKASFEGASARVDQMKRGATAQDLQQAQGGVDAAQATLVSAEARLKQLQEGATVEDQTVVEAGVAQAEQALALAKQPYGDHDLAQARNAVTAAEQQYKLAASPYTENDLDQARAAVLQAQAGVDLAESALGEATVLSPMDGVVSDRQASAGALVSPATPIVSVITGEVELVLGVEESQIGQVKEGQKAEISVAAYPGVAFPAKVAVVAPSADPRSRTFQVKVRPEGNDGRLKQGMFGQVKVITEEKDEAVLVPKEAVVTRSGQSLVFVLKEDAAQQRPVKLGLAGSGTLEVLSGLQAGEEVIVAGQNDLRDGDKVRKQ